MEEEGRVAEIDVAGEGNVEDLIDGIAGDGEGMGEGKVGEGVIISKKGMEIEGATMEGEGSWIHLEVEDNKKKKGMRKNETRGKEGSLMRKRQR